jgi:hypothetical protein
MSVKPSDLGQQDGRLPGARQRKKELASNRD